MKTKLTSLIDLILVSKTKSKTFYKLTYSGKEFARIHTTKEDKANREITANSDFCDLIKETPELAHLILTAIYK
jgi:hypothetical protein